MLYFLYRKNENRADIVGFAHTFIKYVTHSDTFRRWRQSVAWALPRGTAVSCRAKLGCETVGRHGRSMRRLPASHTSPRLYGTAPLSRATLAYAPPFRLRHSRYFLRNFIAQIICHAITPFCLIRLDIVCRKYYHNIFFCHAPYIS